MPEIMNPHPRQTCLGEGAMKPFAHPRSIGRLSNGRREDQARVVPHWSSRELVFNLAPAML
jgi:hypothetical protein